MKKYVLLLAAIAILAYGAYEALMYYDNNFMYGRMRQTPAVRPYEKPLPVMDSALVPFGGGERQYRVARADELQSSVKSRDPQVLARGKKIYFTYCAQCHGKNFDGYGTVGQSFAPPPANLKSPRVQAKSEGTLFQEISYGIPGGRQPPLATTIDVIDRWRVVAYVKSLAQKP